jgi:hypothetical protein
VQVDVEANDGEPVAICPGTSSTRVGQTIDFPGDGIDDVAVVSFHWRITGTPAPNAGDLAPGPNGGGRFTGTVAGDYEVELIVRDADGHEDACSFTVRVS